MSPKSHLLLPYALWLSEKPASELRTPLEMLVFPWIVDEDRGGGTLELGSGGIGALRRSLQLPGKFVLQSSSTRKKSSAQD